MIAKIIGSIWIILGIVWLIKPEGLKNRLKKKMGRRAKWIICVAILILSFSMIGSAFGAPGMLPKIIAIIGIIMVIRIIIMVTSKTSEKIFNWWADRPIIVFRVWALIFLMVGVSMVFFRR